MTRHKKNQTELLSQYIDDLNAERKSDILSESSYDQEMEELLETVRSVKRLKNDNPVIENTTESIPSFRPALEKKKMGSKVFPWIKMVSIAAVIAFLMIFSNLSPWNVEQTETNLVNAMVKAYQQLESYQGEIEIRSYNKDEIDFLENIEVKFKKPNKYVAVHHYGRTNFTQLSDGDKLVAIDGNHVVIDYANPEKELWKYHIGEQIQQLIDAKGLKKVGEEVVINREAVVYQYQYANESYKIWVDKETDLPLQKELTMPDHRRLVNTFVKLEINAAIKDSVFTFTPTESQTVTELNKKIDLSTIFTDLPYTKNYLQEWNKKLEREGLYLEEAIKLEEENWYTHLVKWKSGSKEKYLDIYLSQTSLSDPYFNNSTYGLLQNGWVELHPNVVNLFKVYIGQSNMIKWVKDNQEMVIVTNLDTNQVKGYLEEITGEIIKPATKKDIEEKNEQ